MQINLSERCTFLRNQLSVSQSEFAKMLGVSRNYVSMLERGKEVDENSSLYLLFCVLEESKDSTARTYNSNVSHNLKPPRDSCRNVPVLGLAHAGEPTNYDEIPEDWRELIATECRDRDAFAVKIIGDSMEPKFQENDVIVLMPSEEVCNGCLAVAKFADGGFVFRRFEIRGEIISTIAVNVRYPVEQYKKQDFEWIYPAYESRRLLWNGK